MAKDKNIQIVGGLRDKVAKARSLVVADYRGLTHKQAEELHKLIKQVDGEFIVTKNSLLKIASEGTDFKIEKNELTGPTAAMLAYGDEVAPIKELFKFIKTTSLPKVKFGFIGGVRYADKEVEAVAKLPSKEVLYGQLVSRLNSPMSGLVYALNYNVQKLVYVLSKIGGDK